MAISRSFTDTPPSAQRKGRRALFLTGAASPSSPELGVSGGREQKDKKTRLRTCTNASVLGVRGERFVVCAALTHSPQPPSRQPCLLAKATHLFSSSSTAARLFSPETAQRADGPGEQTAGRAGVLHCASSSATPPWEASSSPISRACERCRVRSCNETRRRRSPSSLPLESSPKSAAAADLCLRESDGVEEEEEKEEEEETSQHTAAPPSALEGLGSLALLLSLSAKKSYSHSRHRLRPTPPDDEKTRLCRPRQSLTPADSAATQTFVFLF